MSTQKSVKEICEEYANKQISRDELVELLAHYPYEPDDTTDGYDSLLIDVPNSWSDVDAAVDRGWLDDELFEEIFNRWRLVETAKNTDKSVNEICEEYTNKEISRDELIELLAHYPYAACDTTDGYDWLIMNPPNTWADVSTASRRNRWLEDGLYEAIFNHRHNIHRPFITE